MLQIIFKDDRFIAIHKPAGLLVHRTVLDRHETQFAVQLLRDQIGREVWPVHRLDRGTSGVLLFALDKDALTCASRMFETNEIAKTYLAVVRGWPGERGSIDHPLSRQYDDYKHRQQSVKPPPQTAITHFERLGTVELPIEVDRYPTSRYAFVRAHPETGRRHQIRRHFKHISHPIIGDATHGKGIHNRMFAEHFGCNRLLLACTNLTLRHPTQASVMELQAPIDGIFADLVTRLGWNALV